MDEHEHGLWSTREEERTFRSVRDLLMEMRDRGRGIFIRPVREDEPYGVDGWVVGELGADGHRDLAVGPWLEQVVDAARAAADDS
ncbi:MAG TPA: hypothetical protein VFU30_12220 [Gaiellaceae bacterium]|nr:hypothetical protein [Gaiellaceae bacterium]